VPTKLSIGFRGLCLFTQKGNAVEVSILDASQATNAADRSALDSHDSELWIVEGTVAPPASKTVVIQNRQIPVVTLSGNTTLRIANGNPAAVALGNHLPNFPGIDTQVRNVALDQRFVAATFVIDRGTLSPGPLTKVKWHGSRVSSLHSVAKQDIPEYMLLEFATDDRPVTISRGGVAPALELTPNAANEIDVRIGAEPVQHVHGSMVHHFKWFYRHMDFGGQPVLGLAFPEVVKRAQVKGFFPEVLSGSSFCPDGQYP
jgi:hypothetical protein